MRKIENIQVKVTYLVGLCDVDVPDDVYEALSNSESEILSPDNLNMTFEQAYAMEWLASEIREKDACERQFVIERIN